MVIMTEAEWKTIKDAKELQDRRIELTVQRLDVLMRDIGREFGRGGIDTVDEIRFIRNGLVGKS